MPANLETGLSVFTGAWDDVPTLLTHMGLRFKDLGGKLSALENRRVLDRSRAVYIACGGDYDLSDEGAANLRAFVERGGGLYISDMAASVVERAFPEKAHFSMCEYRSNNVVQVKDAGLRALVGSELTLHMDFTSAQSITWIGEGVQALIAGPRCGGEAQSYPYLIAFSHGAGEVLYSVFHNANQVEKSEEMLLEYLMVRPMLVAERRLAAEILKSHRQTEAVEILAAASLDKPGEKFKLFVEKPGALRAALVWDCEPGKGYALGVQVCNPSGKTVKYLSSDRVPLLIEQAVTTMGRWSLAPRVAAGENAHVPYVLRVVVA